MHAACALHAVGQALAVHAGDGGLAVPWQAQHHDDYDVAQGPALHAVVWF